MSDRRFALLGSGEFEPWSAQVDRWALAGRTGRVLVLPTASAPEGDDVFDSWAARGLAHHAALGIDAAVVPLKTRADADRPELIGALDDAAAVYFSGGNPAYLAAALRGSAFWQAVIDRLDEGLAYIGCSAGVAGLTGTTFDSSVEGFGAELWKPGLSLFRDVVLAPHWDMLDEWIPGARGLVAAAVPAGAVLVGIDETTAIVGDGRSWRVLGTGGVHVLQDDAWAHHGPGVVFDHPFEAPVRER